MRSRNLIGLVRWGFLLVMTPLILSTLVVVWFGNSELQATRQDFLRTEAETASRRLNDIINHSASFVSIMSIVSPDDTVCPDALGGVMPPFEDAYSVVAIAGADGRLDCAFPASAVNIDISDRPWFRKMVETGEPVIGGYQISRATEEPELVVARPGPEGTPYFVGAGLKLEYLSRYLAGTDESSDAKPVVIDTNGLVVASLAEDIPLGSSFDIPTSEGFISLQLSGSKREVFVQDATIGDMAFRVIAIAPKAALLTPPERVGFTLIVVTLLLGLITAFVGFQRLQRDVIQPIIGLRDMAPKVAGGNPDRVPLISTAPEEVKQAVVAFNDMVHELRIKTTELQRASNMAGLGIWRLRSKEDAFWLSENMRDLFGFPDQSVRIHDVEARIEAEDLSVFRDALHELYESEDLVEVEFRARDAEGRIRYLRAQSGLLGAEQGEEQAGEMVGILQDITDVRRREEELERSRALLRVAGDAARIRGWRFDKSKGELIQRIERGSTQVVDLEEAMDRFVGEGRARVERSFWACVSGGVPFDEVVEQRRSDGTQHWVRLIGEAERDEDGKIIAVHGASQDIDELIRARLASAEMEELLRGILDFLGDGFIVNDQDGKIRYINGRAHVILNLTGEGRQIGNVMNDHIQPDFAEALTELRDAARKTKAKQSRVVKIANLNKWVELNVHPSPNGVAIHLRDVTRDFLIQERLRLLNSAIDRINEMVIVTKAFTIDSPDGPEIVYVNDAFVEITGFQRDEAIGKTPRIIQGPDTERHRLDAIRAALESEKPIRSVLTNYRKDGSKYILEIDISPMFDKTGACTHFVSVQRDVTERKQAEELLLKREDQFRLASMATKDLIWDWDIEAGTMWNSSGMHEVTDGAKEWQLETFLERVHPEDRENVLESLGSALAGNSESWRNEFRFRDENGTYLYVSDRAFIQRAEDGTPRRMVGAMTDVSEIRMLDAQLHQSQKLETVGKLTGGIAHDFNNLLTIILGNADMLLDQIDEGSGMHSLVKSIEEAAERGAGVSAGLLAYARRQPLEAQASDINELIRNSSKLFERAIDARIDILYDLSSESTVAMVDPEKLQAALLNLILNAQAAIANDGKITVKTMTTYVMESHEYECSPGDYVEIQIIDTGIGMEPEVANRAFEPFFTTKEPGLGTGLGLSSVYGLVKQSGGHVDLVSEPGVGTKIILCLPVARGEEPTKDQVHTETPQTTGNYRILIVEDDAMVRDYVETSLKRMGHIVSIAEDGRKALEILETDAAFDLMLTDVIMPGRINGIQLAARTKKLRPDLKVIFMSGYTRNAFPDDGEITRETPILYKPFRKIELAQMIQNVMAIKN